MMSCLNGCSATNPTSWLRWGDPNKNKYKNPHKLLAEQYTRLAEHHRDLMEVRTPEDD
jgi:hypothetical protein